MFRFQQQITFLFLRGKIVFNNHHSQFNRGNAFTTTTTTKLTQNDNESENESESGSDNEVVQKTKVISKYFSRVGEKSSGDKKRERKTHIEIEYDDESESSESSEPSSRKSSKKSKYNCLYFLFFNLESFLFIYPCSILFYFIFVLLFGIEFMCDF